MLEKLKALGDETRLRIFNVLREQALCVCEIETLLEISQSNTSRHLTKLKSSGIITSSKDAQWVHYELSESFLENYKGLMEELKIYFESSNPYQTDTRRYKNYKTKGLSCVEIKNDVTDVLEQIK